MKITINGRFLLQPTTGVQRYARELVDNIDDLIGCESGIDVEVVLPKTKCTLPSYKNIELRQVGRLRGHAWEQLEFPFFARGERIFCPANTAPIFSLLSRKRVYVTVHDLSYKYFPEAYSASFRILYRFITPLIMKWAKVIITVSESEKNSILTYFPKVRNKIQAIQNGNSDFTNESSNNSEAFKNTAELRPYVLYVGSFSKRKNFERVIQVANLLTKKYININFVFVGSKPRVFLNTQASEDSSDSTRIKFIGQLENPNDLMAYYEHAELLVFPSLYESSGLPPTEAMSRGCPCVVSRIPALIERCGDSALYCDPNNVDSIMECVEKLIFDPELRSNLVASGLRRGRAFSWRNCASETLKILLR